MTLLKGYIIFSVIWFCTTVLLRAYYNRYKWQNGIIEPGDCYDHEGDYLHEQLGKEMEKSLHEGIREREKRLFTDEDCPEGYVCVNGACVPVEYLDASSEVDVEVKLNEPKYIKWTPYLNFGLLITDPEIRRSKN